MKAKILAFTLFTIFSLQATAAETVVLNPESLRTRMISDGLPILAAANRVHKAKDTVNLARARLLPSLNLGALAASIANPTFILASVEYVLPFLIPARWFDVGKAKYLAQAERAAFLLTELNLYASLYSLYYTVNLDLQTREFLTMDFRDAVLIEQLVERAFEDGRATEMDLNSARSQSASAKVRLARFNELLVDEISVVKQSIGLPMETSIQFERLDVPPSPMEEMAFPEALALALEKAPESEQIKNLLEAAKKERWSKQFGFISGASASNKVTGLDGGSASFAFSDQGVGGFFNFGFDYFPNISLSHRNIEELQIREAELNSELARLVDSMQGRLDFVKTRHRESTKSENLLKRVFENDQQRYAAGDISLMELTETMARYRQAGLERLRANTDLQLLRVSMHRIVVGEQFAEIKGCEVLPKEKKEKRSGWRWPWESDEEEDPICDPKAVSKRFSGQSQEN